MIAINLGFGQIIDLDKKPLKILHRVNFYIALFQIIASGFTFFIVFLFGIGFFSILKISFGTIILNQKTAEFLVLSSFIIFASGLLTSGILMIYINKENVSLGV